MEKRSNGKAAERTPIEQYDNKSEARTNERPVEVATHDADPDLGKPADLVDSECGAYYRDLHTRSGQVLEDTLAQDDARRQARSHAFVADLERCVSVLTPSPESYVWRAAIREYQFALLALVQGHYRNAFMSLRLFLELALAAVHYSTNRLELQEWIDGQRDLNWNTLTDCDSGVLSKRFARAFFPALEDETPSYAAMAKKVYHECSEYVHGNRRTQALLPETLTLETQVFDMWHGKADVAGLVALFSYSLRHLNELGPDARNVIESPVLDRMGHLPAVRAVFGGPGGI